VAAEPGPPRSQRHHERIGRLQQDSSTTPPNWPFGASRRTADLPPQARRIRQGVVRSMPEPRWQCLNFCGKTPAAGDRAARGSKVPQHGGSTPPNASGAMATPQDRWHRTSGQSATPDGPQVAKSQVAGLSNLNWRKGKFPDTGQSANHEGVGGPRYRAVVRQAHRTPASAPGSSSTAACRQAPAAQSPSSATSPSTTRAGDAPAATGDAWTATPAARRCSRTPGKPAWTSRTFPAWSAGHGPATSPASALSPKPPPSSASAWER